VETDQIHALISARDLTRTGLALGSIKRYGGQLFPKGADWYGLNRGSDVAPDAALGVVIVAHLLDRRVIMESDALSVVAFFREAVARYGLEFAQAVAQHRADPSERPRLPLPMLEILDGRWARLSSERNIFDIETQSAAKPDDLLAGGGLIIWSHSLCLAALFLQLCPLEKPDGDDAESEATGKHAGE
jgi:hypothetical protein